MNLRIFWFWKIVIYRKSYVLWYNLRIWGKVGLLQVHIYALTILKSTYLKLECTIRHKFEYFRKRKQQRKVFLPKQKHTLKTCTPATCYFFQNMEIKEIMNNSHWKNTSLAATTLNKHWYIKTNLKELWWP